VTTTFTGSVSTSVTSFTFFNVLSTPSTLLVNQGSRQRLAGYSWFSILYGMSSLKR
jgi:hypothetical protein